jgi:hypothetical protein
MSKTIEIASIHKGKIATKVKGGPATVEFVECGTDGVFLAMCDNDEAGAFLAIGLPDYWEPKVDADLPDGSAKISPAFVVIGKIRKVETLAELDALIIDEDRKSVLDEAAKRSKQLTK